MTTATRVSAQLAARSAASCLHRLRMARTLGDERDERVYEMRLNWLIDKIHLENPC